VVEVTSPFILGIGFLLGLEHAFDADHVVAVSTIICNTRSLRKSLMLGTVWGLGHTITIFLAGVLVLGLKIAIPAGIAQLFELIAGIMLVFLGIYVIRGLIVDRARLSHSTNGENDSQSFVKNAYSHTHGSLFAGALQGLGGSAALMLVTLSTVGSATIGVIFIAIFGVGVILGMLTIGALIGGLLVFTALHLNKIHEAIRAITGCISIGFGIFIITSILLTGNTIF
jgi:sulfite exporter TauE/SafE